MNTTMTHLELIKLQARQDAARYSDVNAACPYPFVSQEGATYRDEFLQALAQIEQPASDTAAPEPNLCTCHERTYYSIEERDCNKCDFCGKPFVI